MLMVAHCAECQKELSFALKAVRYTLTLTHPKSSSCKCECHEYRNKDTVYNFCSLRCLKKFTARLKDQKIPDQQRIFPFAAYQGNKNTDFSGKYPVQLSAIKQ